VILIASKGYWSTGISLRWREYAGTGFDGVKRSGWGGKVDYCDDGFCDDDPDTGRVSTEGTLVTRYSVHDGDAVDGLTAVIDTLLADAKRLGIEFRIGDGQPMLFFEGDGENEEWPPPAGWRETLREQAERIGWRTYGYEPVKEGD
jgi:hypothetical protein